MPEPNSSLLDRFLCRFATWNSLTTSIRTPIKSVIVAILVSFALVGAAYLILVLCETYIFYGAKFYVRLHALVDSILAGIVAFVSLSSIAFYYSLRRPEDDALEQRISYLFSASKESEHAHTYIKDQVAVLGATIRNAKCSFDILELSPDKKFVRTSLTVRMDLVNMMKRDSYEQKMPLVIKGNDLPDYDGLLGLVHYVRTTPSAGKDDTWGATENHLPKVYSLTRGNVEFRSDIPIKIPAAGILRYEYAFDAWSRTEEVHFCGANRFVETFDVTITNHTASTFVIEPHAPTGRKVKTISSHRELSAAGGTFSFTEHALPPSEDISVIQRIVSQITKAAMADTSNRSDAPGA